MNKNSREIDFSPTPAARQKRTDWLIFFSVAVILFLLLGESALLSGEGELAEAARQIFIGNDIFAEHSVFVQRDFSQLWFARVFELPLFFFGEGEFGMRAVSVAAALFLLAGTMILAEDIFDRKTMYCCAWLLAGSYGFVYWGRFVGSFMILAAWMIWSAVFFRKRFSPLMRYSGSCFLILTGSMWWGLNYLLPLFGVLLFARPDRKNVFSKWQFFVGLSVACAAAFAVSVWMVWNSGIDWTEYPSRIWMQICRTFFVSLQITAVDGGTSQSWYSALLNVPRLMMPWILPTAIGIAGMVCRWKTLSAEHRRLLVGAAVVFLLEVYPGRRWQYHLVQLPLLMIICGGCVSGAVGIKSWNLAGERIMKWAMAVAGSFAVSVFVTWPLWQMVLFSPPPIWMMTAVPFFGLMALAFLVFDTGPKGAVERISGMRGSWSGYILAGVCLNAAVFCVALPSVSVFRTGHHFWRECGKLLSDHPRGEILLYGNGLNESALYYSHLDGCRTVSSADGFAEFLSETDAEQIMLIVRERDMEQVNIAMQRCHWKFDGEDAVLREANPIRFSGDIKPDAGKYGLFRIVAVAVD